MKKLLLTIGCLVAGVTMARQQTLAQLAPSQFADTEVSTNLQCALNNPALRQYEILLGLIGTPSNNVEVALGHDADGDWELSLDETALSLAWDCGEWMVKEEGRENEVPLVTYGPDTNGFVTAVLTVPIRRQKSNPDWLYDPTWNMVRVTKRGIDEPMERVTVATRVAGTAILVK